MQSQVQLLVLDIDGVITDGRVLLSATGEEVKAIDMRDVDALVAAGRNGLALALLTGEDTPWVDVLAAKIGVRMIVRGQKDKLAGLQAIAHDTGVALAHICYVGDAVRDAPALRAAGLGIAPANAVPEAKAAADVVTTAPGGDGAVRELLAYLARRDYDSQTTKPTHAVGAESSGLSRTDARARIAASSRESIDVFSALSGPLADRLIDAAELVLRSLKSGGKLLVFGNGGSAAEAQHIVGEFVGRFAFDRDPLAAIALTTDTSVLTALVNDYPPDLVFARQVRALGRPGDVVMGLSTSGRSPNVVEGLKAAREMGLSTIALSGRDAGPMAELADVLLPMDSTQTPRVQEGHLFAIHVIAGLVERAIFPSR
jgi:D-sedoheptulose 7-phosphate isomerase